MFRQLLGKVKRELAPSTPGGLPNLGRLSSKVVKKLATSITVGRQPDAAGTRAGFALTPSARIEDFPRDLHLGCGGRRAPGFCNVDITPQPSVDIVDNVVTLKRFPDDYASSIYACHVLEHFSHAEAPEVLKTWFRVLAPGGTIRISVPDIDRIVKIYVKNWDHFQKDGHSPWIGLLYGGQTDSYDFHKTGWNFCWMSHIMRGIGYVDMQEYPHEPHFVGAEFWDNSLAHEPFGEFLSLNLLARKPAAAS